MGAPHYIVTFKLYGEVVSSRHKTLKAARRALAKWTDYNRKYRCRIYKRVC